jgi:hypothetical protein
MAIETSLRSSAPEHDGRLRFGIRTIIAITAAVAIIVGLITHHLTLLVTLFGVVYFCATIATLGLLFWLALPVLFRTSLAKAFNRLCRLHSNSRR